MKNVPPKALLHLQIFPSASRREIFSAIRFIRDLKLLRLRTYVSFLSLLRVCRIKIYNTNTNVILSRIRSQNFQFKPIIQWERKMCEGEEEIERGIWLHK